MGNKPGDQTQDARERARLLLGEVLRLGQAVGRRLTELRGTLTAHLPEGLTPDDTFVPAAEARLSHLDWRIEQAEVALRDVERPTALDASLYQLGETLRHLGELATDLQSSLVPFVARAEATVESGTVGPPDLSHVMDRLDATIDRIEALTASQRTLAADSALAVGRELWVRAAKVVGEDRLESLWLMIIRGVGQVDELAEAAGLDDDAVGAVLHHVAATSLRVQDQVASGGQKSSEPEPPPEEGAEQQPQLEQPDSDEAPGSGAALCLKLQVPDPVEIGRPFELSLTLRNDDLRPVQLDSVDLDDAFIGGFEVLEVEPAPTSMEPRQPGQPVCLDYDLMLRPGAVMTIKIQLRGRREGNFTGSVSAWTDQMEVSDAIPNVDVVRVQ